MRKFERPVQYVLDETVAGMNAGFSVEELMSSIALPQDSAFRNRMARSAGRLNPFGSTTRRGSTLIELVSCTQPPQRAILADIAELMDLDAAR